MKHLFTYLTFLLCLSAATPASDAIGAATVLGRSVHSDVTVYMCMSKSWVAL